MKELKQFRKLSKEELKTINGGMNIQYWCKRRSENFIDLRPGAPKSDADKGFLNDNGCWVYPGMPWNAHPSYPPSPILKI